jgi:hypothetical protein
MEIYLHSPNTPSWRGAQVKAQSQLYLFTFTTTTTTTIIIIIIIIIIKPVYPKMNTISNVSSPCLP